MNKDSRPLGPSGNELNPGDPYGGLFGDHLTDQFDPLCSRIFGNASQWDMNDFKIPGLRKACSLCDPSFDFGLDRGRGKRAFARAIHLSPNAPSFDIYLDGKLFYSGLAYHMQTDYTAVRPGSYRISVYPAGTLKIPVFSKNIFVTRRSFVSYIVCGLTSNLDVIATDDRAVIQSGRVKIKVVHLSADIPAIDLLADRSVWFNQVKYREASEYMTIPAGRDSLSVRLSGTRQTVLTVPNIQFLRNRAYTIYVTGLLNGSPPLQLFVTIDGNGKLQ